MVKRRSTSRSSKSGKKCMRPGPITNNGYLNFLRVYRKTCCGMSPQETVIRGAEKWMSLSEREREKYNRMACRPRSRPRKRTKAKKCMRPGPITNNGYLNFMRMYRKTCCGMTPQETIKRGAKKWMSMSEEEREKYYRAAENKSRRTC
ncbi:uncharacterized protein ACRADG_007340 [Cochliomyia hominivorax]